MSRSQLFIFCPRAPPDLRLSPIAGFAGVVGENPAVLCFLELTLKTIIERAAMGSNLHISRKLGNGRRTQSKLHLEKITNKA